MVTTKESRTHASRGCAHQKERRHQHFLEYESQTCAIGYSILAFARRKHDGLRSGMGKNRYLEMQISTRIQMVQATENGHNTRKVYENRMDKEQAPGKPEILTKA